MSQIALVALALVRLHAVTAQSEPSLTVLDINAELHKGSEVFFERPEHIMFRCPTFTCAASVKVSVPEGLWQVGFLQQGDRFKILAEYEDFEMEWLIPNLPMLDASEQSRPFSGSVTAAASVSGPINTELALTGDDSPTTTVLSRPRPPDDLEIYKESLGSFLRDQDFTTWLVLISPEGTVRPYAAVRWGFKVVATIDCTRPVGRRVVKRSVELRPVNIQHRANEFQFPKKILSGPIMNAFGSPVYRKKR